MSKMVARIVLASTIAFTDIGYAPASYAQVQIFEVAPQALETALFEFAEKARISINFSGIRIGGLLSPGTKGHTSKSASLRALLSGTGLGFSFKDDTAVQLFHVVQEPKQEHLPEQQLNIGTPERIIEDLVITASKRPSNNFKLPVSVSAVSSLTLEDLSAYDFQSVAPHLAGVLTTNLGPGRNKIFVRGLSDGVFSDRTQAMVGVYIDETPVNYSDTNPDIRLFDVERVELLRGPQGTLYGSGSLAGVYRVITAKPDLDATTLRTRLSGAYTKFGDLNGALDLAFNTPLITDKLGFRLSGYVDLKSGFIDDINLGLKDVNSLQVHGVRPALRWKMNDVWTLDLVGNFQAIRFDDAQYYQVDFGRNKRANGIQEPYSDTFFHGNLTLTGAFSSLALTSATAFVKRSTGKQVDATAGLSFITHTEQINSDLFSRSDISIFSESEEFLQLFDSEGVGHLSEDNIRIFSHETRVRSQGDSELEWMAGLYYQGRRHNMGALLAFVRGNDPTGKVHIGLAEDRQETSDEFALFGEASYHLTDKLSVTTGARYSRSLLKLNYVSILALNDNVLTQTSRKVKHSFVPKLAVKYEWTDNIQSYALASVGYRIGALNINTPVSALLAADPDHNFEEAAVNGFQSDNLFNGELGLKSYWFDRQLGLNVSAFMVRWYDIQSDQLGPSGLPLTVNVGEARIVGYEAEFTARPFAGLEVNGSFFWNDSELRDDNAFLGAKAGDRLPAVPERTASVSLLYEVALSSEWVASLQADYSYIGKSALNFNEGSSAAMGGYGILNTKIQFTTDRWKLGLYARNLTDTKANTFSYGNGFRLSEGNQITPPRPITAGLFLEVFF